jgi:hypothetical protein
MVVRYERAYGEPNQKCCFDNLLHELADDPVNGEPVSEARFPANREKNREFRENRAVWQKAARQNVAKSVC